MPHRTGYLWQAGGYASRSGVCRPFDAGADGTVFGSGGGVVVLRPLARALACGDRVLAVIKGSAVYNDGAAKPGFAAPSVAGQARTVAAALAVADVPAGQIGAVEAHGTGTPLGDPTEVAALTEAFAGAGGGRNVALGSVKGNIGHLDAAAGIAGLIKLVLARAAGRVPASLHFERPNPEIDFAASPFHVNTRTRPWPAGAPFGGVSALGIGGTNAHVVIGPAPDPAPAPAARPAARAAGTAPAPEAGAVLVLAARSEAQLRRLAGRWSRWLDGPGRGHDAAGIAAAAAHRRADGPHRLALAGRGPEDWAPALAAFAAGTGPAQGAAQGSAPPGIRSLPAAPGGVAYDRSGAAPAWIFAGQGAQSPGMARFLRHAPGAGGALQRFLAALPQEAAPDALAALLFETADTGEAALARPGPALMAHVALQCALTAFWRAHGLAPAAVLGLSAGEIAAAEAAGCITLEDAARTAAARAAALSATDPGGHMAQLPLDAATARQLIERLQPGALARGTLWIAVEAGPESTVIAGRAAPMAALCAALEAAGPSPRPVPCGGIASHGPAVQDAAARIAAGPLPDTAAGVAACPVYPCTSGWEDGAQRPEFGPAYWAENLARPVRFDRAFGRMLDDGQRDFLEIAPRPQSLFAIDAIARQRGLTLTLRQSADGSATLLPTLQTLATLIPNNTAKNWRKTIPIPKHINIPKTPLTQTKFWVDPPAKASVGIPPPEDAAGPRALFGDALFTAGAPCRVIFAGALSGQSPEWQAHRVQGRVTLPAAAVMELAVTCAEEVTGSACAGLRRVAFVEAISVSDTQEVPLQMMFREDDGTWRFALYRGPVGAGRQGPVRDWSLATEGEISRGAPAADDTAPWPDSALEDVLDGAELYALLDRAGVAAGDNLRLVERVAVFADRVAAQVTLKGKAGTAPYPILDAAFQTLAAAPGALVDGLAMPTALDALDLHAPIDEDQLLEIEAKRGGTGPCDITVMEPGRRVLMNLRRVETSAVGAAAPDSGWLHRLKWSKAAAPLICIASDRAAVRHAAEPGKDAGTIQTPKPQDNGGEDFVNLPDWSCLAEEDLPAIASVICAELCAAVERLSQPLGAPAALGLRLRRDSDETPAAAAARGAAMGFLRTLAVEFPELHPHVIEQPADLAHPADPPVSPEAAEPELRYRRGQWQAPRITPLGGAKPAPALNGAYLVTGANGLIGPDLIRWLARHGASELLLVLRGDAGPDLKEAIETARAQSVVVKQHRLDLSKIEAPADWQPVLDSANHPLRGVFHLAGLVVEDTTLRFDRLALENAVAVKVRSLACLARILPRDSLRHLVLFSSMAGRLGAPGLAVHGAASAALSELGEALREAGLPAYVLEWGPWAHAEVAHRNQTHQALGFGIMPPSQGFDALAGGLSEGPGTYQIFNFDPSVWAERFPSLTLPPILNALLPVGGAQAPQPPRGAQGAATRIPIRWQDAKRARGQVRDCILTSLSIALGIPEPEIDPHRPFAEMNLSSMMALELRAQLEEALGIVIPTTTIWRHPTVERLTQALIDIAKNAAPALSSQPSDSEKAHEPYVI